MKTNRIIRTAMTVLIILVVILHCEKYAKAQVMALEKTFAITGEANIGKTPYVEVDPGSGNIVIRFLVKQKGESVTIETYTFDKDYNNTKTDKEQLDLKNAREKYPWWDYAGDKYENTSIVADEKDDLVLKKKESTYTYDWVYMTYQEKSDIKDKVKLKNDEGAKYYHYRNWVSEKSDDFFYVLCGVNEKADKLKHCKDFRLIRIDKNLDIVKDIFIHFDYPQEVVYPRFADEKTELRKNIFDHDILLVFAPRNEGNSVSDKNPSNYTYISINENLELIDRIPFSVASTGWSIEDKVIDEKTGDVYFFGAAIKGKNKYYDELKDTKKFDGFQVMKVSDHKIAYLKEYSLEDLKGRIIKSPSQKEAKPYNGKKFFIASYTLTSNGSLFIVGQNWSVNATATMSHMSSGGFGSSSKEIEYLDCFGLGFDKSGNFLGQYLYDTKAFISGQKFSLFQFLFPGKDPDHIYWLLVQPSYWSWASLAGYDYYDTRPSTPVNSSYFVLTGGTDIPFVSFPMHFKCDLISSDLAMVDLKSGLLSDFSNYQVNKKEKTYYYLCPKMPFIISPDNDLVLFGSQSVKKGKTLWFGRIKLD